MKAVEINKTLENNIITKNIADVFGSNVNFAKLIELILSLTFKNPDNYYKVKNKNIMDVISERLNLTTNVTDWSNLKSEIKSIYKNLNNSNSEKPFIFVLNSLWYSSLPCFDVQNITAGEEKIKSIHC
jgi:hypothetical protein